MFLIQIKARGEQSRPGRGTKEGTVGPPSGAAWKMAQRYTRRRVGVDRRSSRIFWLLAGTTEAAEPEFPRRPSRWHRVRRLRVSGGAALSSRSERFSGGIGVLGDLATELDGSLFDRSDGRAAADGGGGWRAFAMSTNVGWIDRGLRAVLGLVLLGAELACCHWSPPASVRTRS